MLRLPFDLHAPLLSHLEARDLARAAKTCALWRALAPVVAEKLVRSQRNLPAHVQCVCWIRSLAAAEAVRQAVGPKPLERCWQDEWVAMCSEWYVLLGGRMPSPYIFSDEGPESVSQKLQNFALAIEQKICSGWAREPAEAVSVIVPCGHIAIAKALQERDSRFAASTYAVVEALFERACVATEPAPPLYAALSGEFGLATNGPEWQVLTPQTPLGTRFVTSAPVEAIVPDARTIQVDGYHTSVNTGGLLSYKLAESDIVCIISSSPRSSGFRSLVQTATAAPSAEYMLPPLSTVRLEKVEEPGTWRVRRRLVRRRLYTVSVEYS